MLWLLVPVLLGKGARVGSALEAVVPVLLVKGVVAFGSADAGAG